MTITTALDTLNITIGDSNNFALTPEEKTRALTDAFNDPHAVTEAWDSSLTFDTSTSSYTVPITIAVVREINIDRDGTGFYEPIAQDLYDIVDGQIRFAPNAKYLITQGKTLYIKGVKKLLSTDTIADDVEGVNLQEYIIALATIKCIDILLNKKVMSFLKNDTSVGELVAVRREKQQTINEYRNRIRRLYESV